MPPRLAIYPPKPTTMTVPREVKNSTPGHLDSIDGKIAQLQNRTQELAFTAIDSEDIKIVIDGLSTIVELITKIVDIAGTIPTLTTLGAGILSGATGVG